MSVSDILGCFHGFGCGLFLALSSCGSFVRRIASCGVDVWRVAMSLRVISGYVCFVSLLLVQNVGSVRVWEFAAMVPRAATNSSNGWCLIRKTGCFRSFSGVHHKHAWLTLKIVRWLLLALVPSSRQHFSCLRRCRGNLVSWIPERGILVATCVRIIDSGVGARMFRLVRSFPTYFLVLFLALIVLPSMLFITYQHDCTF